MSHELRTPLHTILGFTQLLQEQVVGDLNSKQERFVRLIQNDAELLLNLINGLLDVSKIEEGRLDLYRQSFDLASCIADCVANMRVRAAEKSIALEDRTATT